MSVPHDRLPNIFLLGAAKSGTTSLHAYLNQHPDITFTSRKEPHFFDNESDYRRGIDWYVNQYFGKMEWTPVRGDATPMLHLPEIVVPNLLRSYQDHTKALKFIVLLRNPVERAWSHYLHLVRNSVETESLARGLELEEQRLAEDELAWMGYFRDGCYGAQLTSWLESFQRDQFLILFSADLEENPQQVIQQTLAFLGVEQSVPIDTNFKVNAAAESRSPRLMSLVANPPNYVRYGARTVFPEETRRRIRLFFRRKLSKPYSAKPEIDPAIAADLYSRYAEDVMVVEMLTGRNLASWRTL